MSKDGECSQLEFDFSVPAQEADRLIILDAGELISNCCVDELKKSDERG